MTDTKKLELKKGRVRMVRLGADERVKGDCDETRNKVSDGDLEGREKRQGEEAIEN